MPNHIPHCQVFFKIFSTHSPRPIVLHTYFRLQNVDQLQLFFTHTIQGVRIHYLFELVALMTALDRKKVISDLDSLLCCCSAPTKSAVSVVRPLHTSLILNSHHLLDDSHLHFYTNVTSIRSVTELK